MCRVVDGGSARALFEHHLNMALPALTPPDPQKLLLQDDPMRTLAPELKKAAQASVEEFEPPDAFGSTAFASDWFWFITPPADLLPPWGLRQRDLELRRFAYNPHNWLAIGAITNEINRYAATPWELKGGRSDTEQFTDVFQNAEFDEGYGTFITKVLWDYFTQDFGAVIEVVAGGDPNGPIGNRPVLGLNHLDSLRCIATGNLEYPIIYWSHRTGTMHRMHRERVIRIIDMPSPEERAYNNGLCALSRVIAIVNAQILLSKHQNESLSDMPPTGLMTLQNVKPGEWMQVMAQYEAGRKADGASVYRNFAYMESQNPGEAVKAEVIRFSMLPDNFSYREYIEMYVNGTALGLGIDPQDIWPLTGQALGTGAQSQVLHAKGKSKTFGTLMRKFERVWNIAVLPEALEFTHKYNDPLSDQEEAATAKLWIEAANLAPASAEQKLQLIANKVPAYADVLLDESGQLRLPDVDKKPVGVLGDGIISEDANTLAANVETPVTQTDSGGSTPVALLGQRGTADEGTIGKALPERPGLDAGVDEPGHAGTASSPQDAALRRRGLDLGDAVVKDIQATRLDFEGDFADAVSAAQDDDISRRRFGIVARALITRYGRQAYTDGLEEGGVEEGMSDEDRSTTNSLIAEQSSYVTDFADRLFDGSEATPEARASAWFQKSVYPFYLAGLQSSDSDGLYEWVYGDTEHCADCQRLNGQKHRMSEWMDSGWLPKSSELECHGDNCSCELVKARGRASGEY